MVNRDRDRARIRESARRRVSQPIVAPGAESQLKEHLLQSICATAGLSLVMIAMIVRFQKEMRLVSLEIPEPNATKSQIDQKSCNQIHSAAGCDDRPLAQNAPTSQLSVQVDLLSVGSDSRK